MKSLSGILSFTNEQQVQAAGKGLSTTKLSHIYVSSSIRAYITAQAIQAAQQNPQVSFTINQKLRELHFGLGEGRPEIEEVPEGQTVDGLIAKGIFPRLTSRSAKFPGGESLDDLAHRAEEALVECVLPHLLDEKGVHIAIISHGLCILELIAALLRLDPDLRKDAGQYNLPLPLNAAYTRVTVSVKGVHAEPVDPTNPPALNLRIMEVNNAEHLASISTAENKEGKEEISTAVFSGEVGPSQQV